MLLDQFVDLADRVTGGMPGPGQALGRIEHADTRCRTALRDHEIGQRRAVTALWNEKAAQIVRLSDRRRQSDAGEIGSEHEQSHQSEREQIAPFRCHQRMQLVEHDPPERPEEIGRIGRGQDQRKLLGCREQNFRRVATLPLALRGGRVAGAGLDPDWQSHLGNRPLQVARDVDRERLER